MGRKQNEYVQNLSEREIAVNKFWRDKSMEKAQVFRCKAMQKVQKGFVLDVAGNVLDMRWIR